MEKEIPVHKEEVLSYLKQTLRNALSTLDRLMVEDNPVLIRGHGEKGVDGWCVKVTNGNKHVVCSWLGWETNVGAYVGIDKWGIKRIDNDYQLSFDHIISEMQFFNLIGYVPKFDISKQKEQNSVKEIIDSVDKNFAEKENILERGKEVLNSQNEENYIFKMGDYVSHKQDIVKGHTGVIISCDYKLNQYGIKFEDGYATYHAKFLKLEPKKEVLFTTEDGIEVYEPCAIFAVGKKSLMQSPISSVNFHLANNGCDDYFYFAIEVKAKEYILMNKPLLSLNDILEAWGIGKEIKQDYSTSPLFLMFKAQAKLKLNKGE